MYNADSVIRAVLYVSITVFLISGTFAAFALILVLPIYIGPGLAFFIGAGALAWIKYRGARDIRVIKWVLAKFGRWLKDKWQKIATSNGEGDLSEGSIQELLGAVTEVDEDTKQISEDSDEDGAKS